MTMASEWAVTTEKLKASAEIIEEKTSKYNTEWQKLYTEIQSLKASQWQGKASEMFNKKLEGYRNDFEEMAKVLLEYADFLKLAAEQYEKTEAAIESNANGLYTGV